ncbi:MAG TPA: hypothetical protein VMN60_08915 [Longimicrobiales bacterium]|nr:hypothetical protein [Longimicrobiales bacterium]
MKIGVLAVAVCSAAGVDGAHAQRLLEEWQVRPDAGADAFIGGSPAVFWNPSQLTVGAGRFEASLLDLRAPGMTGVSGVALAGAARLQDRTVVALGFEHVGVDGLEETTTTPEGGAAIAVGESRFAAAAAHMLSPRLHMGAAVQYTRLPSISEQASVLALRVGVRYRPLARLPLELAAAATTEGEEEHWLAGAELASGGRWPEVLLRAQYGAAGGELAPGVTHRVALRADWRQLAEVTVGAVSEPDGAARALQPVLGAGVTINRYRLGLVREALPNDFGAAYSFRFAVGF